MDGDGADGLCFTAIDAETLRFRNMFACAQTVSKQVRTSFGFALFKFHLQ